MPQSSENAPTNAANWLRHPVRQRTKRSGYASHETGLVSLRRLTKTKRSVLVKIPEIRTDRSSTVRGPNIPARSHYYYAVAGPVSQILFCLVSGIRNSESTKQTAGTAIG